MNTRNCLSNTIDPTYLDASLSLRAFPLTKILTSPAASSNVCRRGSTPLWGGAEENAAVGSDEREEEPAMNQAVVLLSSSTPLWCRKSRWFSQLVIGILRHRGRRITTLFHFLLKRYCTVKIIARPCERGDCWQRYRTCTVGGRSEMDCTILYCIICVWTKKRGIGKKFCYLLLPIFENFMFLLLRQFSLAEFDFRNKQGE